MVKTATERANSLAKALASKPVLPDAWQDIDFCKTEYPVLNQLLNDRFRIKLELSKIYYAGDNPMHGLQVSLRKAGRTNKFLTFLSSGNKYGAYVQIGLRTWATEGALLTLPEVILAANSKADIDAVKRLGAELLKLDDQIQTELLGKFSIARIPAMLPEVLFDKIPKPAVTRQ